MTLVDPNNVEHHTVARALRADGAEIEAGGTPVAVGRIQLVVDSMDITEDWCVRFGDDEYEVIAVTPYLKRRIPRRKVLVCEPRRYNV